jgi:hypothetical protein
MNVTPTSTIDPPTCLDGPRTFPRDSLIALLAPATALRDTPTCST